MLLYEYISSEMLLTHHHGHPSAVDTWMFDDTIWRFHALGFA